MQLRRYHNLKELTAVTYLVSCPLHDPLSCTESNAKFGTVL